MTTALDLLIAEQRRNPSIVSVCTHTGITQAHLDECCADGVDCDQCGQRIEGLDPSTLALGEIAVCRDCGLDHLYRFDA